MGMSGSKSKTSSTTHNTVTPTPPTWLEAPNRDIVSQVSGLLNVAPSSFLTAPNANLTGAWARARQGSGAGEAIAPLTGYNATAGTVTPGLLSDVDLSRYMNPYTQSVIDTSVNDMNRARQMAINGNSAAATLSAGPNAFMSDRAGVADAETNRGFLDSVASLTANLRNQGFNTAQSGAQFDIGNRMAADTGNRDAALSADLASAAMRLNAGNALGSNYRADTEAQAAAGERERAIEVMNNPNVSMLQKMQAIQAILNGVPIEAFTGQVSDGTTTGTTKNSPGLGSILGSVAQVGSMFI